MKTAASCIIYFGILVNPALASDPWADQLVEYSSSINGSTVHRHADSVLGPPATGFFDDLFGQFVVSLAAGPFNLSASDGDPVVTTINAGEFIKVAFDEPVEDHPRNPYGIDLIVFGNSFFTGFGFVTPETNMSTYVLTGGLVADGVTVAVSPTGIGTPQTHPQEWHVYSSGPFADTLYPTQAFDWDRDAATWAAPRDFTVPVDPLITPADVAGRSAADAMDVYELSGGGTGFDLAESGFASIRYVYLTSSGGEVDALSDVFALLGDHDRDGDLDLRDIAEFQTCFADTDPRSRSCFWADFDGDGDVDETDYEAFAGFLDGP